jgi:ubiquitin C-terminal hydrolase
MDSEIQPNTNDYKATLANLGATCFMNSTIQAICRSGHLHNHILSAKDSSDSSFIVEWKDLIRNFNVSAVIAPRRYLSFSMSNASRLGFPELGSIKQHDAHEYLLYWISMCSSSEPLFMIKTNTIVFCKECKHKNTKPETSPIIEINPIFKNLKDAIIKWFEPEQLDDYTCDNCKNKNVSKQIILDSLPNIFVISLKKYHMIGRSDFDYPDQFIMNGSKYSLVSVICHEGSLDGGHYYTIARNNSNSEWIIYNDTHRSPTKEFLAKSAYILLYDKI